MSSKKPGSKKSAKSAAAKTALNKKAAHSPRKTPGKVGERPLLLLTGTGPVLFDCLAATASAPYEVAVFVPKRSSPEPPLLKGTKVVSRPDPRASVVLDCTLVDKTRKRALLKELDETYGPSTLILSNALTVSVAEQASWIEGRHRLLGVGLLPGFLERPLLEVAPSAMTLRQTVETAIAFFASMGKHVEIVQDRVGMVAARVICQIINEAAFALQDDVASPEDIDTSMKLGVSYPYGPFEWADRIGCDAVVAILQALQEEYQEERYRVSPLLKAMAFGGTWWKKSERSTQLEVTS